MNNIYNSGNTSNKEVRIMFELACFALGISFIAEVTENMLKRF